MRNFVFIVFAAFLLTASCEKDTTTTPTDNSKKISEDIQALISGKTITSVTISYSTGSKTFENNPSISFSDNFIIIEGINYFRLNSIDGFWLYGCGGSNCALLIWLLP